MSQTTKQMRTSAEWQQKRDQFVSKGVSNGNRSLAVKGEGAVLYDLDGRRFVDFAGAIGTLNVGHSHPKVVEAVKRQTEELIHPGFNVMMYPSYIELAEKLCGLAPGEHDKKAIFLNSGAEAVENAVKIARKYTKRQGVVTFTRGFHGRTNMTMSMTSKVKPYKFGFGPFAPEVYQAPFPYYYQKPAEMSDESYDDFIIQSFHDFFVATVAPETVACVVMEPVQGEGGFIIPSKRFVQHIADFCKQHGIVFVADEIQTGFARTGTYFAIEHFDVVPDLITVSKSLAAGIPLSGVIGKAEMMDAAAPGELGGTYAGSPLGCAAALAVLEIIEHEGLNERSEEIGRIIEERALEWKKEHAFIGEIRRLGAMAAVEIVKDPETREPDKAKAAAIAAYANDNGLLLLTAGINGNIIRFLTPLVITDEQLKEGLDIIEAGL
ncbi:4-aminobutyrate--2-oxoglutarate transaminase [Bacillus atrophaeus]|uniref:4-aminobutyrate--2-oxoglutarate transaminase n=1 Tax=Bacillus atrophaeus TaxID=1452 RepID=UPI00227F83E1|nr:4-aminobutyrate--2-oxoglutarate transaminase [Bacillus atrophaeus]MCY8827039.1 4-aminobutyrate--2-oxoglutarate transaminase [Bacillus atrophaeus]MCY8842825.1 4-aminobutyrate--2-oxoglutarate transaminase [Bacillus atrophaeus]MEC0806240.1 4-aminobutyrate--2-oxoglutarate transaminase [Bacillus atrophaeus]MEC0853864.1 4-aminobutyrate--2-oxoglutarate transaminase [Bacillus atrophaeus]MEC0857155.1 4-aminobutyrate--2-oxoglutarate transaminase [Bacillus atrophaeus]